MTKWDAMRAWLERSRNAGGLERGHGADAGGNYCVGSGMTPNAAQPHFTKRKETTMELLKNYTDAQVLTLADTPTPPPMAGIWTLTAPDGQTWTAESPMRCASVEMAGRVAPLVALARIRRTMVMMWLCARLSRRSPSYALTLLASPAMALAPARK